VLFLVRKERIISTDTMVPRAVWELSGVGCLREEMQNSSGQRYELCRGVHAEQNAIINAAFYGVSNKTR
jgi:dCMP deaminase